MEQKCSRKEIFGVYLWCTVVKRAEENISTAELNTHMHMNCLLIIKNLWKLDKIKFCCQQVAIIFQID